MATFTVTTTEDQPYNGGTLAQEIADDGSLSLREALALANENPDIDEIVFASGTGDAFESGGTITLIQSDGGGLGSGNSLDITQSVRINGDIDGDGTPDVILDADTVTGNRQRIFTINSDGPDPITAELEGLMLTGGLVDGGNNAARRGGAIFVNTGDDLVLVNSTLTDNTAQNNGGGIFAQGGSTITIKGSSITQNTSGVNGGAIQAGSSELIVEDSEISGNMATGGQGGAIRLGGTSSGTISGSTISGNSSDGDGGGIWSSSNTSLSIRDTRIDGNTSDSNGGGIQFFGESKILAIVNSQITNNSAATVLNAPTSYGGGVNVAGAGDVYIINSLFQGNYASAKGGGLNLTRSDSTGTILNSTFTQNQAGREGAVSSNGGAIAAEGALGLFNTTVTGNIAYAGVSGGVLGRGTTVIANTIIAGNSAPVIPISPNPPTPPAGDDVFIGTGFLPGPDITLAGSVIFGTGPILNGPVTFAPGFYGGVLPGTGAADLELIFANAVEIDPSPANDTFNFFGGGLVGEAVPLNTGTPNPAIDTGTNDVPLVIVEANVGFDLNGDGDTDDTTATLADVAFDQIGLPRGVAPDAGAVQAAAVLVVDTNVDEFDGDFSRGDLSLREAIALANIDPGTADIIRFDATVFTGGPASVIRLDAGLGTLEITGDVTIDGSTATDVLITGDTAGNDLDADGGLAANTTGITNVVLTQGASAFGDNIRIFEISGTTPPEVMISGLVLTGGAATGSVNGGAIRAADGSVLTITDSSVVGNYAQLFGGGGGIATGEGSELTVVDSILFGNIAGWGGAIFVDDDSILQVERSVLTENRAQRSDGGAMYVDNNGTLLVTDSSIVGNHAQSEGGGINTDNGSTTVLIRTDLSGNEAGGDGGGIEVEDGTSLFLVDSRVDGNRGGDGGGIHHDGRSFDLGGEIVLINSAITNNVSSGEGGGFFHDDTVAVTIVNSTVAGNASDTFGGGIFQSQGSTQAGEAETVIVNSTITGNHAQLGGGGIFVESSSTLTPTTTLANTIVAGNAAPLGPDIAVGNDQQDAGTFAEQGDIIFSGANLIGTGIVGIGRDPADPLTLVPSVDVFVTNGAPSVVLADVVEDESDVFAETLDFVDLDGDGNQDPGEPSLAPALGGVAANNGGQQAGAPGMTQIIPTVALQSDQDNPALDMAETAFGANNVALPFALDEAALGVDLNGDGDTDDVATTLGDIYDSAAFGLPFDQRGPEFLRDVDLPATDGLIDLGAFELARLAVDDTFITNEDTPIQGNVLANDISKYGDSLTASLDQNVSNGTLAFNGDGTFTYAPEQDFNGTDIFSYTVFYGNGDTSAATVTIDVNPVNDPPVAQDDALATDEDTAISGDLTADNGNGPDSDVDGDTPLVYLVNGQLGAVDGTTTLPSGALLTVFADGRYIYHPNGSFDHLALGETAIDSFTYAIFDGNGGVDSATATVTIDGVNDAPDAVDDDFSTDKDSGVFGNVLADNGNGADSDPDGGTSLIVTHVNGSAAAVGSQILLPSGALLMLNADGSFLYGTNGAFEALGDDESFADSFTYTIGDGDGGSDGATATVTIDGGNEAPVAADDALATDEDTAITGNVFSDNGNGPDSDANGDTLTVSAVNGAAAAVGNEIMLPSGARLTLNSNGSFVYDPMGAFDDLSPGEADTDGFAYTVTDGKGGSATATVSIGIDGLLDVIRGTPQEDDLTGTDGDDLIYALASDDIIDPRSGSHTIDGGSGADTVVYATTRSVFDVDLMQASGFTVAGESAALVGGNIVVERPDGETDTLIDVERIDFTDGDLIYDIDSPNVEVVYRMYAAALGRTPDETGLRYWVDRLDFLDDLPGSTADSLLQVLADVFIEADEFEMLYGSDPSNADYIDAMYQNVLGRLPDDEGRAFWIDAMERGLERDDILIAFSESAENRDQTAPDLDDGIWVL